MRSQPLPGQLLVVNEYAVLKYYFPFEMRVYKNLWVRKKSSIYKVDLIFFYGPTPSAYTQGPDFMQFTSLHGA